MTKPRYAAVLFDCDGVLIDSETLANRALQRSLADLGMEWDLPDIARRFTGHSWQTCVRFIEEDLGGPVPADFMANNRDYFSDIMARELTVMEGVDQVLAQLSLPFAVVTNSQAEELAQKMSVTGLGRHFPESHRFNSETLGVSKPDPAIYRKAADALDLDIRQCLVVEDSLPGLTAASESGAEVWAYQPHVGQDELDRLAVARTFHHWSEFSPALLT